MDTSGPPVEPDTTSSADSNGAEPEPRAEQGEPEGAKKVDTTGSSKDDSQSQSQSDTTKPN